jgi:diguanylate cyclase (GGDEF)-like protein
VTTQPHQIEPCSICKIPGIEHILLRRSAALAAALLFIFVSPASHSQSVTNSTADGKVPTITSALRVHNLSDAEAGSAIPVHLRGVITYLDPDFGSGQPAIFIHDATGSVFIKLICKLTCKPIDQLFVGALVDVRGVSAPGGYGSVVGNPEFRILGRVPLPANPARVTLGSLKTGVEDAQWVEVEGSVHRVIEYERSVTIRLEMLGGPINVTMVKEPGADYSHLVDAQVQIDANAAPTTNSEGQMIGVHLQAPNLSTLQVLEPAPRDPYARPAVPIDRLLHWGVLSTPFHRVHLRGVVTLQWPGSTLCVRDSTRGICARTSQTTPVAVGSLVDVAGFVETENSVPIVADAIFQGVGNGHLVEPWPVTTAMIKNGRFDSELIQIDGLLIGYDLASSNATLQLSSGDSLFPVILPKNLAESNIRAWKIGSRVRVIGICSIGVDVQNHVRAGVAVYKSFRILMRSPADVILLEKPSWWTPAHALILLGIALTGTLFVLGWVVVLRRRIELQANQLRESEQTFRHLAHHDSLTGLASRLVLNDRLRDAMESAHRHREGLALLMLDLDKFKTINDTFGHQAGDEVLCVSARRLQDVLRASDTVIRLGGDEFVVLLPQIRDSHTAEMVAASVVSSLSQPVWHNGFEIPVSISVGIGTAFAGETDAELLLRQADAALYSAKKKGRHCFKVFVAGMEESVRDEECGRKAAVTDTPNNGQ